MPRAVLIERRGSVEDLVVREVPRPEPGPGEVRVRVRAAGLNPVDWKIIEREGSWQAFNGEGGLPTGNGNDLAGLVDAVGPGVAEWRVDDEVLGGRRFHAQADFAIVAADALVAKPEALTWEQAGSLQIAARTAAASVRQVAPQPGETVLVSAAAGGVGVLVAQLVARHGATAIGTASDDNHEFLRSIGVVPVAYGDGMVERIRAIAPAGVDAVLDNHGRSTMEAGLELGVDPARINTIADRPFAAEIGATTAGGASALDDDLADVAALVADGSLVFPVDSVYPIERVVEAYRHLRAGHLRGKVVLVTE
ncbi:oxidoreductase [Agromyces rhizosphaerae]|uniref:Oxidoreductase n=1 Tax=Agromyces rhizosphaerae TaxID=88374 RepID=A0A9W6CV64_9MICO|nr:NADP-dependent oxidoreductase [Agromyces rhizosphaerae]GLI25852.1 oxidoreductase [Agromyces rhizosphaerae]